MKNELRTKQVTQKTGIGYQTLKLYAEKHWTEQPVLRHFGKCGGRGSSLFWPEVVIRQVGFIKLLKSLKFSTIEIDRILKGDPNK